MCKKKNISNLVKQLKICHYTELQYFCSKKIIIKLDHCCTLIIECVLFDHCWMIVMAESYQTQKPG